MRNLFSLITIFILILCSSCGSKEARRPVMVKTNTFLKESAEKNKKMLELQEAIIDSITKRDTLHHYLVSKDGFKYYYISENKEVEYTPKFGDIVEFSYKISDIYGKEIYPPKEKIEYHVDKEELFQGLRSAIKILKDKESAVFYFPSEIAFGYRGDTHKIGSNKPIVVQVHIFNITPMDDMEAVNSEENNRQNIDK